MKIILIIITFLLSRISIASTTVEVVYGFGISTPHANIVRLAINNANEVQTKYNFVFVSKPGAGGAIAANYVLSQSNNLRIFATTSSLWIRPLLSKEGHYNVKDFTPLAIHCRGDSLALVSKKTKTLDEFRNNKFPTVGIVAGSSTQLTGDKLSSILGNKFNYVNYKGHDDIIKDIMSDILDYGIIFPAVAEKFKPTVIVLGITGTQNTMGNVTFSRQGLLGLEQIENTTGWYLPKKLDPNIKNELLHIVNQAVSSPKVKDFCEKTIFGINKVTNEEENNLFFKQHGEVWDSLVNINK